MVMGRRKAGNVDHPIDHAGAQVTARMSPELKGKLEAIAHSRRLSVSKMASHCISEWVQSWEKRHGSAWHAGRLPFEPDRVRRRPQDATGRMLGG